MVDVYIAPTLQEAITGDAFDDDLGGNKTGLDNGSATNGDVTSNKLICVAHNHSEETTEALLYYEKLTPASGEVYDGSFSPEGDFARIVGWGDSGYGVKVEFDWELVEGVGLDVFTNTLRTGEMNDIANAMQIAEESMAYNSMGATYAPSAPESGKIYPIAYADKATKGEGCQFYQQIRVPTNELANGWLEFDLAIILEFIS